MTHTISMEQALGVWGDLCDAQHGNGWGGDVAQVYLYRLMPDSPGARLHDAQDSPTSLFRAAHDERVRKANEALYALLRMFSVERRCAITVEGRRLGAWLRRAKYDHRVHVRVREKRQ